MRSPLLGLSLTFLLLFSSLPAFALLVGDDGLFEPIIVQIKDSLRTSTDLDTQLAALASLEKANGLTVAQWYAGRKLLVTLSFPKGIPEDVAQKTISLLQLSPAVEKVVVQSAYNLEFKSTDFSRSYQPDEIIPDAALRGFDVDRLSRPQITYDAKSVLPLHAPDRVIVRWKDEYVWSGGQTDFRQSFANFNEGAECTVVEERQYTDHDLTQILEFDPVKYSVIDQLLLYQANDLVDYVQADYIYEAQTVPNDPIYAGYQWSLPKISAPSAWSITTGLDNSVIIGILDTGANVANTNGHIAHPDFVTNLWSGQNNGEKHNFTGFHQPTDVYDYLSGHGSNVASIAGAQGNNGPAPAGYMCGVSWNVSLMHLKVLDDTGFGMSDWGSAGIEYAWQHGASAINLSWGEYYKECDVDHICDYLLDPALVTALQHARDGNTTYPKGAVAVCSAGNDGLNIDNSNPFSPAGIPTDNVISVAASDQNDARASFSQGGSSNFGVQMVDLAGPGKAIYGLKTTYNGNSNDLSNYSVIDGTSQAAPHVTGTIALLKAKYGWENYHGLRDRVLMGTDDLTAWTTLVRTGGRLNANKALHARTLIRNLSTRARVENLDRVMIGGFTIGGSGTGTLKVAIRGLGPSLDPVISVAYLADPKITLYNSAGTSIRQVLGSTRITDIPAAEWDELNADGLIPGNTKEPAMIMTLAPGSYTVAVESQTGTTGWGVGLFDMYELEGGIDEQTRLLNVSTRCLVRTGEEQAIAGLILGDPTKSTDTTIPKRSLLIFGKGPGLPSTIVGRLANPFLVLKNSAGTQMSSNDSWQDAMASVVKAADASWTNVAAPVDEMTEAGLDPSAVLCGISPCESALWPILKSGTYTTILSGVSGGTGVGLVELYEY